MKDLNKMNREDIFNSDLIGEGLPDLQTEIDKIQNGQEGFDTGFGGNQDTDIFGFGSQKNDSEVEEED